MKVPFFIVAFMVLVGALAQKYEEPKGVIYGTATTHDGHPAKGIKLTVDPIGNFTLGSVFPTATTNQAGEYRIELLSYKVYAEDQDAGYSAFSTGFGSGSITLTSEDPTAEYRVSLPPRAGFLQIHLTNRRTGTGIPSIVVTLAEKPAKMPSRDRAYFAANSNAAILVPPDKNLWLHVVSDGFAEWEDSLGAGKPINIPSGSRLTLDVKLEPLKH